MIVLNDSASESPDVSVLIPTYNRIRMLPEALNSVLSQDFEGSVEIIVVDDHSPDATAGMIRQKYPDIQLVRLDSNIGNYAARNVGLSRARGKYVAFLDDDDLWERSYLRTQVDSIRNQSRTFAVSGLLMLDMDSNRKTAVTQEPDLATYSSPVHQLLIQNFIYTPSSTVFPRVVLDEIGNFDSNVRMGGDADLYIRCLLKNIAPTFTKLPLAIWRVHRQGKLTDVDNFQRANQVRRIEKYYERLSDSGIGPKQKVYAELDSHLARRYLFQRRFSKWFLCSLRCGTRGYPGLMMKNVFRDVRSALHAVLKGSSRS